MKANLIFIFLFFSFINLYSQQIQNISLASNTEGLSVTDVKFYNGTRALDKFTPLFSAVLNDSLILSSDYKYSNKDSSFELTFPFKVEVVISVDNKFSKSWKADITFVNNSNSDVKIENVVPLGELSDRVHISASGPWRLARAKLFRPGKIPLRVMMPDNAWELGYAAIELDDEYSLAGIARRVSWTNAERRRYWTVVHPGGDLKYSIYLDLFQGDWQSGLIKMFRDNFLFDLNEFDNSLFERKDLQWIRDAYCISLLMAWDKKFYNREKLNYSYDQLIDEGNKYFGGYDIIGIWPTWPTLGLDQRNQWDLYRDLPGGIEKINSISKELKKQGIRFFISYNPWDMSARQENHFEGLSKLIKETDADGVVIDTRGKSSYELQAAADRVKEGVVMYSEGMAVIKDMPGIIAGRAHNAIFYQPELNLNKLIKPEFGIFRVLDAAEGELHREIAVSFFNGYGNELNMFRPGRPGYIISDFLFLGKLTKLLRENSSVFNSINWTPLIETTQDSIWVNQWNSREKTIYTVYSLVPGGFEGDLFKIKRMGNYHFVDLLNHFEMIPVEVNGGYYAHVNVEGFDKNRIGTRGEGSVGCIARFRNFLHAELEDGFLSFSAEVGTTIKIWRGDPSYQNEFREYKIGNHRIALIELGGNFDDKIIVQLFNESEIIDERIITVVPGTPVLVSKLELTEFADKPSEGMVEIPAGEFAFRTVHGDAFIPYPDYSAPREIKIKRFFMDKFPVTNSQFKTFLNASEYFPSDTVNYLKNWVDGTYPEGAEDKPVVYVSQEDAAAYAEWKNKRLPTEIEWQYAAQTSDTLLWPWGNEFDSSKCNYNLNQATDVDRFHSGMNKFGLCDLSGNVWQLTHDIYFNGSYSFVIIKGGSYFKPTSSRWYVQGGPQPLNYSQMLLRVSPGFERNATVGFRCVKDAL